LVYPLNGDQKEMEKDCKYAKIAFTQDAYGDTVKMENVSFIHTDTSEK
jgi:hypothetical protein